MPKQESADIAQALHGQQAETHRANLPWVTLGSLGTALFFVMMQAGVVPAAALGAWLAALVGALAVRLGTGFLQQGAARGTASDRVWLLRHRLGFLAHGIVWGLASFLPIPHGDIAHQAVTIILLVGIASGSFALTAFDLVAALAFGIPALGLLCVHLFAQPEPIYLQLGIAGVAGLTFMSLTARRAHLFVRSYMARRLAEAEQAQALRSSEELLERTGATAGVGGWEFDVGTSTLRLTAQAFRIHGIEPDAQPDLETVLRHYTGDGQQSLRAAFASALQHGEPFDLELRLTTAAGQAKWVRLIGQPQLDSTRVIRVSCVVQDITASKTTELALAEKHHLLELLVRTTSEGFWFVDTEAVTTEANPAMCRILGRSREELIGKSIFAFVDEPNAAIFRKEIRHRAEGRAGGYEIALMRPDGSRVDCFNHATPIFDTQGRRAGSIGMWTDISERKRAEQRLRATSEQLSQKSQSLQITLDSITQGIVTLDAEGRPLVHNRRVQELLDLPEWMLREPYTYDDVVRFQIERGELAADGGFVDADGERRHFRGGRVSSPDVYVRRAHSGALVEVRTRQLPGGGMVRTFADVTAYIEAQQALRDSEAQMRAMLDTFPGFIAVADAEFRYTYVNQRLATLLGRSRDALIGSSAPQVLGEARFNQLQADVASLQPGGQMTVEREYAAGAERPQTWIQVTYALGREDDGAGKFYAFGIDITARKVAEQALIVARDEAQRANRAKSQFLSSMSHELRTPMNAILGFGQLLVSDPKWPLADTQGNYVQEILRGARHLLNLINEVLDLALVETGKLQVSLEPVRIDELLKECLGLIEPLSRTAGISVQIRDESACACFVRADRTRLTQVLLNLLSNAIKYNRPGGQVHIACAADGDGVRIAVTDTGPGLDAAQQARLFEAFERLDAPRTPVEGAGLGLALSKRLMRAMAGEIGLDSRVGEGSTFWIRLVRCAAPGPIVHAQTDAPCAAATPARSRGVRTVLYIEDNPVNALLMDAMLARVEQVRLINAALPEQGLSLAAQEQPDLILLDIQLPGMDGFEVLRRLRLDDRSRTIPVIAVSANAMPSDIAYGMAAGFEDYLTKPLDMQRLLRAVEGALVES